MLAGMVSAVCARSAVLQPAQVLRLFHSLPTVVQAAMAEWELIFSTARDGSSIATAASKITPHSYDGQSRSHTLLVVQSSSKSGKMLSFCRAFTASFTVFLLCFHCLFHRLSAVFSLPLSPSFCRVFTARALRRVCIDELAGAVDPSGLLRCRRVLPLAVRTGRRVQNMAVGRESTPPPLHLLPHQHGTPCVRACVSM